MEEPIEVRRTGRTTRQIDEAIQVIFSGKEWVAKDHCDNGENHFANSDLFFSVIKRLTNEHNLPTLLTLGPMNINKEKLTIQLIK